VSDIFLSYAREDEARIQQLISALSKQGWSVFWDQRIPAGQTWRSYIGKALGDASCVIVAWSHQSIASSWVSEESEEGKQRGILVPVLLDSVQPPIGFRSIQAADLTDWEPGRPSSHFSQLVDDINVVLGRVRIPSSPEPTVASGVRSSRRCDEIPKQRAITSSRRLSIMLLAAGFVFIMAIGYWGYRLVSFDSALKEEKQSQETRNNGQGSVKTSEGTFHFDKITGMSLGLGKLTVIELGSRVDIPISSVVKIIFLQENTVRIQYENGESEEANFSCYWNAPVTFHVGEKEIYYGDCEALGVVEEIEFLH